MLVATYKNKKNDNSVVIFFLHFPKQKKNFILLMKFAKQTNFNVYYDCRLYNLNWGTLIN